MIPVYTATSLEKTKLEGGTTLPSIMAVAESKGTPVGDYVVKTFDQKHIDQYNPTAKELYANILAQEFDLKVPEPAIINVDKTIIDQLNKEKAYQKRNIRPGYYFGCEYIEGTLPYSEDLHISNYDPWEIETIFAFDVLIRNFDRRTKKPNIIFKGKHFYLIDHDLSLDIQKSFSEYEGIDQYESVAQGAKGAHIFLNQLQKQQKKGTVTFDGFIEILRYLDIGKLNQIQSQLDELGMTTGDFPAIKQYLLDIKNQPEQFQRILLNLIQQ